MFGGENFEKEVDRGTGRSGGDWRCRGRFPSLEAIKPVGRKTSRRKAVGRKRPTASLQGRAMPAPPKVFGFRKCGSVESGWGQPVGQNGGRSLVLQRIHVG